MNSEGRIRKFTNGVVINNEGYLIKFVASRGILQHSSVSSLLFLHTVICLFSSSLYKDLTYPVVSVSTATKTASYETLRKY